MDLPKVKHELTYPGTHASASSFVPEKPVNSAVTVMPSLGTVHACWTSAECGAKGRLASEEAHTSVLPLQVAVSTTAK